MKNIHRLPLLLAFTVLLPQPLLAASLALPDLGSMTQNVSLLNNLGKDIAENLPHLSGAPEQKFVTFVTSAPDLKKIVKTIGAALSTSSDQRTDAPSEAQTFSLVKIDPPALLTQQLIPSDTAALNDIGKSIVEHLPTVAVVPKPRVTETIAPPPIHPQNEEAAAAAKPSFLSTIKINVPTLPKVTVPTQPVIAAKQTTSSDVASLREEISSLRQLVGRQSDSNAQTAAQAVSSVVPGVSATASNAWRAEQTFLSSTTLQSFTFTVATGTTANVTNLTVTSCTGCSGGSMTFSFPFTKQNSGSQATSTVIEFVGGLLSDASSTFSSLIASNASSTLFSSTIASTSKLYISGSSSNCLGLDANSLVSAGSNCLSSMTFAWPFKTLGTGENATGTTVSFQAGLLALGSGSASSTLASTTASGLLVTGSATSTNDYPTNLLVAGSTTLQKVFAQSATSTNLYWTNALASGSTTLQQLFSTLGIFNNASSTLFSSTIASTSKLYISGSSSNCLGLDANSLVSAGSNCLSSMTFAWPFTKQNDNAQSTTTLMEFPGGLSTNASSSLPLALFEPNKGIGFGTTTPDARLAEVQIASSTRPQLALTYGAGVPSWAFTNSGGVFTLATTSASTYATSTQNIFSISQTGDITFPQFNLLTLGNLLALGSSTFQAFTASQGTITSATSTNDYPTNLLVAGSTTLQSATSTNFNVSTSLNVGSALNFFNRSTTTLSVNDTAWVIATTTNGNGAPLMSFNNSAGTSTIQFFGATTTGLTAGTGIGIPMGNFMIVGDGKSNTSINILRGGLCVDTDGWCTASTTGRISSVSSFIGNSDLAEMYQAGEAVEPGDVVAITSGIVVNKATPSGKEHMMGVISTKPGIVLGSGPDAESRAGDVPVALVGRVPVKVSTENGPIHAGDYLELSATPGVAAKATRAGTAIGQALEDYAGPSIGKVLTFVKNSYYSGLPLENFPGLTVNGTVSGEAILAALESGAANHTITSSDLTADRMLAAVEIITPKVTAGLVSAKEIKSPTIDALSNTITTNFNTLQGQLSSTNGALALLTDRVTALENASSTLASVVSSTVTNFFASTTEWAVSKITAALGTFDTVHVSHGIEMTDTATGALYCVTIANGDWNKTPGNCSTTSTSQSPNIITVPPSDTNDNTAATSTATTTDTGTTSDTAPPTPDTSTTPSDTGN